LAFGFEKLKNHNMDPITSSKNPKIQQVRALINQHKERQESGKFIVEGVRLTEEALASGWLPEMVLVSLSLSQRGTELAAELRQRNVPIEEIDERLLNQLSDTQTSQGILAVLAQRTLTIPD